MDDSQETIVKLLTSIENKLTELVTKLDDAAKLLNNPAVKLAAKAKTAWKGLGS